MPSLRLVFAALVIGSAFAAPAMAQTKTWSFGDATSPGSCSINNGSYGNLASCTQQPAGTVTDLTVRAYSSTGTGTVYETAALNLNPAVTPSLAGQPRVVVGRRSGLCGR